MKHVGASIGVLGIVMGLLACAGSPAKYDAEDIRELRARAAFDLKCDAAALQFTSLARYDEGGATKQFGVTGCGRQTTYVRLPGSETWVRN